MSTPTSRSTSTSTATPEEHQQETIQKAYSSFKHNTALAFLIGAPILIALPPRKLDLYTFSLTGGFVAAMNQICRERTGNGLNTQFGHTFVRVRYAQLQSDRPDELLDQSTRARIFESNSIRAKDRFGSGSGSQSGSGSDSKLESGPSIQEQTRQVWRGEQPPDWKERRLREEQEKLDSGEGYADMIVDQIWDVWNQKKDGQSAGSDTDTDTTQSRSTGDAEGGKKG